MIAFGPVPSRRLRRSLETNNFPPKICSYAFVYCQLDRSIKMRIEPQVYYLLQHIFREVIQKIEQVRKDQQWIDYLTFVLEGEPMLDINLGKKIELLCKLKTSIAVMTNSSLIWGENVRTELLNADWVSVKLDSVTEATWRKINRPHHTLRPEAILDGIHWFTDQFKGELVTETMLVEDVNDNPEKFQQIAEYLARIELSVAYLAVPTPPPAESYAVGPKEEKINRAYQIFKDKIPQVELLIGYEGNAFAFTGNLEEDLLSITAVHPMRADAVDSFLKRSQSDWLIVHKMVQ
jgi:wyosine [tRNA(Phe)-imidazoG37] synthetase (radical SAM superfamily)